ncbi:exodeoxyribonuclease VII small subunit [Fluviibacterium sp. DFM31]|uniref:Exodeoxyribonuclease 7 small subunit n=1 Tax=Meridianimarinicoccus marinus TaxID=3231483 RepID=A0ABV3LAZ4_9RHOB
MTDTPVEKLSFEEAMKALEDVVGKLEAGEVSLDDSIKLYERGAALKKHCEARLKAAEEKIAAIQQNEDGEAVGLTPVTGQ